MKEIEWRRRTCRMCGIPSAAKWTACSTDLAVVSVSPRCVACLTSNPHGEFVQLCRARDRHERRREGVQADITGFAGQQVLDSLPLVITKCKSVHESALFQADSP